MEEYLNVQGHAYGATLEKVLKEKIANIPTNLLSDKDLKWTKSEAAQLIAEADIYS